MAGQPRTVGQGQYCKNRSQFRIMTDGGMDRKTDMARCRVAYPRLKIDPFRKRNFIEFELYFLHEKKYCFTRAIAYHNSKALFYF